MNILSHYFAAWKPENPYYNFGLVFPDLSGVVNRKWKPLNFKDFDEHWYNELVSGCKKHIKVDGIFHDLPAFKENVIFIRKKFEENELIRDNIRLFFVAHIFLELMLDRLILLNGTNIADKFYMDAEKIDKRKLRIFFEVNKIGDFEQFSTFFDRFIEHKYIYQYVDDERLIFALNRIIQRGGQASFAESDFESIKKITFEVQTHLSSQFLSIFEAVK